MENSWLATKNKVYDIFYFDNALPIVAATLEKYATPRDKPFVSVKVEIVKLASKDNYLLTFT